MKTIIFFISFYTYTLFYYSFSQSTAPYVSFLKGDAYGASPFDIGNDKNGNIYLVGDFNTTANFSGTILNGLDYSDAFIAKYNPLGDLIWVKRAGGIAEDRATNIAISDSAIFIEGYFKDSMNFNSPSAWDIGPILFSDSDNSVNNRFIARYTLNGELVWAKRYGGSMFAEGSFGFSINNNKLFVAGYFRDSINFNTPIVWLTNTLYAQDTTYDSFVCAFSQEGDFLWAKRAGGKKDDYGLGVSSDENSVYISGFFRDSINFNTPFASGSNELVSMGLKDAFIAKYDLNGTFLWAKRAGGIEDDYGGAIFIYNDKVYLSGGYREIVNFNTPFQSGSNELDSYDQQEIFIVKYDNDGEVLWFNKMGSMGNESANNLIVNEQGVYTAGIFDSFLYFLFPYNDTNFYLETEDDYDVFLSKHSLDGEFLWARRGGGPSDDFLLGMSQFNNTIYLTGNGFYGKYNFNTPSAWGSNEIIVENVSLYLFMVGFTEGVAGLEEFTLSSNANGISIFPNPNNGEFTIKMPQNFEISNTERSRSIEITSIEGKNIEFETLGIEHNTIQFKIHDPLTGIYILKANCLDGSSFVSRILIK
jgi:hypothetical protein